MERGRTFVSYVPHWKVPSGDAKYRLIKACRKQFLHYYWYVLDPVMGPMSAIEAGGKALLGERTYPFVASRQR